MADCFFCRSKSSGESYYPRVSFNGKVFRYLKCGECGLVFISPSLDERDLAVLYALDYHDEFYFKSAPDHPALPRLFRRFLQPGSLLDYGCGDGSFLRSAAGAGVQLYGAEYNPGLVEKLQGLYPQMRFITVDRLRDYESAFDVIHLGDVLEHLCEPSPALANVHRALKPGGFLFIQGPLEHNFHLTWLLFGFYLRFRKALRPSRIIEARPFHVLYANRKNQLAFLRRANFELVQHEIVEWNWPFPARWKEADTLKQKLQYCTVALSRTISSIVPGWGNRLYYVGRKAD